MARAPVALVRLSVTVCCHLFSQLSLGIFIATAVYGERDLGFENCRFFNNHATVHAGGMRTVLPSNGMLKKVSHLFLCVFRPFAPKKPSGYEHAL
jgi:hypothetical protein